MRTHLVRDALFVTPVLALALVAGCRGDHDRRAYAAPRAEGPSSGAEALVRQAIDDIARARCAHEEHCGRVGDRKRFPNDVACVDAMKQRVEGAIDAKTCPDGVIPDGLRTCLDAVRNLSCSVGYDAVSACERASICH